MKRKPNEEVFIDGDRHLVLAADFGFLEAVNSHGRDVALIFNDLHAGLMPPRDVCSVLSSCFQHVDDSERESLAVDLINRYGLQECAIMARVMLSHGMIGDIKKSSIASGEKMTTLVEMFDDFKSTSLRNLGLLLAATSITSTALVCGIFKLSNLLIY